MPSMNPIGGYATHNHSAYYHHISQLQTKTNTKLNMQQTLPKSMPQDSIDFEE